ncbi:MAG: WD40/YVTN/BNR-like repeat-containing protein, partial [Flavobacteriales bacterium]
AMSGRVTTIDVQRDRPEVIYVGTASGGLWRSETAGVEWTALFDDQPTQSIGAVALAPSNPDVIWVGTGEGNPRNSHSSGRGVFRSIDGGATWELMGLEGTRNIHRIVIHPNDHNTVWVGAIGTAWGDSPDRGVYKTTDGGKTWTHQLYVDERTGVADMIIDPSNPDKLLVAMWSHRREPWFFTSGGEGSGLYITYDGGANWKQLTDEEGLPSGEIGRIGLTISAANPDVIYALVESSNTGLYHSTDGGLNWSMIQNKQVGNRPFYYADIYADPSDEKRLFNLYSMVDMSEDGGKTFRTILPYSGVHPDHHAFYIHPDDPNYLIDGNDGGLNISRDGGRSWTFVNNLPLGQFYHIAVDNAVPYRIYGGMQDNGSWVGPSEVWHVGGIRNEDWQEILFGDGFDVLPAPGDLNTAYAMYQGGSLSRVDLRNGDATGVQPVPHDSTVLRFAWNAAVAADPFDSSGIYFGSQFLHHSSDRGNTWALRSPDLTTNDPEKQNQAKSGGLTIDATQAENHCTILCIAPNPAREGEIWVGTDDGRIQHTTDGGGTWIDHAVGIKRFPAGAWIPQIQVSPHNPDEVYVVVNDYRRNNWQPYLYRTLDAGASWVRLVLDGGEVTGHVLSVVQDPVAPSLLFLGTEEGLFVSFDRGTNWKRWKHEIPSVPVRDMVIHPRDGDLILGTFGRAAYVIDDLAPLRALASDGNGVLEESLRVFEVPDAYQVNFRRHTGARFPADHYWSGENYGGGVRIQWYVQPDTAEAYGEDDLLWAVLDTQGDTLRNGAMKADGGMQDMRWQFNTNGMDWPSREIRKERKMPPGGGPDVLPGNYTIALKLGDHESATEFTVHPDPRVPYDRKAHEARNLHQRIVIEAVKPIVEAMDEVQRALATLDVVKQELKWIPDSLKEEAVQLSDSLKAELTAVEEMYYEPRDFKGIESVTERLSSVMWTAFSINGGAEAPGGNAQRALQRLHEGATEFDAAVKVVMEGVWLDWLAAVEAIDRSPARLYEAAGQQKE